MALILNGLDVSAYCRQGGISESLEKVYDNSNQFTTANGTEIKYTRGVRKSYSVKLGNVPANVKNMIRSRSRYGYITCTIDGATERFEIRDLVSQVLIENESLDLWDVSFTLAAKRVIPGDSSSWGQYGITCDGMTFEMQNNDFIGDIKISNNAGGLPTSGICASQLTFTLDMENYGGFIINFSSAAECRIRNFFAPTYYITGRSLSNETEYTITATDRTIFLDLPFDYTSVSFWVDKKTGTVPTGAVIQEIARQAGFEGQSYGSVSYIVPDIPYADLATSCRSILSSLAEVACGMWFCDRNNYLRFYDFLGDNPSWSYWLESNERTDFQRGLERNYFGVLMINDNTDNGEPERHSEGGTSSAYGCIKVVSKYVSGSGCSRLYERINGKTFKAFSIPRCFCYDFMPIGSRVYMGTHEHAEYFTATDITQYLSPTGTYASMGAEASSESEWDFSGSLTQQVNNRIAENLKYHGVSLSKKDGLKCEGIGGKITMADGSVSFYSNPSSSSSSGNQAKSSPAGSSAEEPQRVITIEDGKIIFRINKDEANKETSIISVVKDSGT